MQLRNIYIITFHCAHNVGAMLQCYALSQKIISSGFPVKVIDYRPAPERNARIEEIWNASVFKKVKIHLKNMLWYPYYRLKGIMQNDNAVYMYGGNTAYRFFSFMRDYLPLTDRTFYSENELECFRDENAVFITGSDQVWNFALSESPRAFLLDFVERGTKNSYAASFGKATIDKQYIIYFEKAFKSFSTITVREKSGIELVNKMSGVDASWVLDPVFLLSKSQWQKLIFRPKIKNPYIFLYRVETNPVFLQQLSELKQKNPALKVVQFDSFSDEVEADYCCLQKGPIDFLSYLFYSDMVLTNSFHGTAFSVIAEKKTVVVAHSAYNERIESLMSVMGVRSKNGVYSLGPGSGRLMSDHIDHSKKALQFICAEAER